MEFLDKTGASNIRRIGNPFVARSPPMKQSPFMNAIELCFNTGVASNVARGLGGLWQNTVDCCATIFGSCSFIHTFTFTFTTHTSRDKGSGMGNVGERLQLFNVDFAGLENLFGGSIFAEEYRGNFVEAGKRITQYENSLQNPTLDQKATVLLLQAMHSNLVGDNRAAAAALGTLLRIEQPFSREWRLRAIVYGLFCLSTTTFPPYFRFCPESLYLSFPNEASKLAQNFAKVCDTLNDPSNDMNRLEYDVIRCLFLLPRQLKQTAFTVNSSSPLTALGTSFETLAAGLCTACQMLASLRDSAHTKHLQSLGQYLDRWIYEICQAQGLSLCYTCPSVCRDPRAQLQNLQKSYQNARDIVGEAVCKLLEGDSAISPPSPILLS